MDVYYDHILTREWERHSDIPLDILLGGFHASLDEHFPRLPAGAAFHLGRIRDEGLLGTYGGIDGVYSALSRIGKRFRKPVVLHEALEGLTDQHEELSADFSEFFPQVVSMLKSPAEAGATNL